MSENFWDSEKEIVSLPKNGRGEEIKVKRVSKKGKDFIDVRTFYPDRLGDLCPGKGISIPIELADDIAKAISDAKMLSD